MALISDISGRRLRDFFDPFEDFFRTVHSPMTSSANTRGLMTSRMDILDRPDHYKVSVELPGVHKDDIRVHLDGNRLYLEAQKSEEQTGEGERVYLSERSYGAIRRTVEMPGSVDPTKVKAEFDNGILKVYVGKKELPGDVQGQMIPIQ